MKTYLPQIERRAVNRPNRTYGILAFDLDNAYPQRVLEMVAASPTAKDCWEKRTAYLQGRGFEDKSFSKAIINSKGVTIKKLLRAVASDKAIGRSFGLHINYNANFTISSVNYVRWEDIRLGDPDDSECCHKLAIYNDWGRKTWKSIQRKNIQYLNRYNPDPEVIKQEVILAGGFDNYKGQLFYYNPEVDDYSLAECDSVIEDIETEAGIKTFANRTVTTGFLPSAILFMKARREQADNATPDQDSLYGNSQPTELERSLGQFQGAKNGQKIIAIEYDEDKPELATYPVQNNDKLFEVTEKSVERRIIKGFSIPKELINSEKATGLSNGGEKKEAIRQFNDDTSDDREEISEIFKELFSNFYTNINPSGNYKITEVPNDVAEDSVGKTAGANINGLLAMAMPRDNKISILVHAYGFKQDQAEDMCPEEEIKDNTSPVETNPNPDQP